MKTTLVLLLTLVSFTSCGQQPERIEYTTFLKKVLIRRTEFAALYNNSDTAKKKIIIIDARKYLFNTITVDVFPYWFGTKWDFNGTTRTPKQGSIACGYFVTNVLTDVGFNIPRIAWAQSASEVFIKRLALNSIKRFSNRSISEVESYLLKTGDGLYLVGLDQHVGFVVVKNDETKFVHSNYYLSRSYVMSEDIDSFNPLNNSNYRVIGKLLSDDMIKNWIGDIAY